MGEQNRKEIVAAADELKAMIEDDDKLDHSGKVLGVAAVTFIEDQMIENAEDALDAGVARQRLRELKQGTVKVVRGKELAARLSRLESD